MSIPGTSSPEEAEAPFALSQNAYTSIASCLEEVGLTPLVAGSQLTTPTFDDVPFIRDAVADLLNRPDR
jgi:hypothetical protein